MKHFRDLLTVSSRFEYLFWRILRLSNPLELHFKTGEKISIRPLPAEDYGTAMEVFLDEAYKFPKTPLPTIRNIFDLGSNVGCSSVYLLRQFPASRITSFEPHPIHASLLRANLERNGLADRATVRHAAVGTRPAKAFLTDQGLSSRLMEQEEKVNVESYETQIVDFYAEAGTGPIDLLKIDIEGSEYELLSDPRFDTLSVKNIVMEWHPTAEHPGETGEAWCRKRLTDLGFTVEDHGGFRVLWAFR